MMAALTSPPMDALHHPAFQSLAQPALLCLACLALLRTARAPALRPWWPMGGAIALALSLGLWPGLLWPTTAQAHKLPWIALLGLLAMLPALLGSRAARSTDAPARPWGLGALAWLGAAAWLLGPVPTPGRLLAVLAGVLLLALLAWSPRAPQAEPTGAAGSAAALAVALLGLTALGGLGGSLLLAQLGLVLTVCAALPGLWTWGLPRSGLRLSAAALMPLGVAGLGLACLVYMGGQAPVASLGCLGLSLTAPWWLAGTTWSARHWRWRPLVVALLAALPVALALFWQASAGAPPGDAGSTDRDDPYYTPRWQ